MNYRLVILSHGKAESLLYAIHSYAKHVQPRPDEVVLVYDGETVPDHVREISKQTNGDLHVIGDNTGFCNATGAAWGMGHFHPARNGYHPPDHVLYLEHDFVFKKDIDLEPIALVLAADKEMAQMSFMRQAVSPEEKAAGGVVASRRGEFERRIFTRGKFSERDPRGGVLLENEEHAYLVHTSYFTTNPSLMRRQFMAENPWPAFVPECEGRFGLNLKEAGFHFGVWGEGNPWVEHIGRRDGHSY